MLHIRPSPVQAATTVLSPVKQSQPGVDTSPSLQPPLPGQELAVPGHVEYMWNMSDCARWNTS